MQSSQNQTKGTSRLFLRQLGLENAKPSPVPGKKLDLKQDTLLNEKDKATYASCVGSGIYLAISRTDLTSNSVSRSLLAGFESQGSVITTTWKP